MRYSTSIPMISLASESITPLCTGGQTEDEGCRAQPESRLTDHDGIEASSGSFR